MGADLNCARPAQEWRAPWNSEFRIEEEVPCADGSGRTAKRVASRIVQALKGAHRLDERGLVGAVQSEELAATLTGADADAEPAIMAAARRCEPSL